MVKISVGRYTYELKDILLMDDLIKVNLASLFMLREKAANGTLTEYIRDIAQFRSIADPILKVTMISGPEIGTLTFSEYITLFSHPSIMGAFNRSFDDLPKPKNPTGGIEVPPTSLT